MVARCLLAARTCNARAARKPLVRAEGSTTFAQARVSVCTVACTVGGAARPPRAAARFRLPELDWQDQRDARSGRRFINYGWRRVHIVLVVIVVAMAMILVIIGLPRVVPVALRLLRLLLVMLRLLVMLLLLLLMLVIVVPVFCA